MRLVLLLLGFFLLAQLLGIFTGIIVLQDFVHNPLVQNLVVTSDSQDSLNAFFFIGYVLVSAFVIVVLIRKLKLNLVVFRIMEFMMIATSSSIVFYAFLRFVFGYDISTIGGAVVGVLFAGTKIFVPQLKNATAIFATAGVGVVFGISLGIIPILVFLLLLSIYDFISVFLTKHMVEIANYVISNDLAFTVTAKTTLPSQEVKRIDLGTGDLIAPIMLEVSLLQFSPVASLFVMIGSLVSMFIFLTLVWHKKLVLPALPPIVLGMVAGLLVGFLMGLY